MFWEIAEWEMFQQMAEVDQVAYDWKDNSSQGQKIPSPCVSWRRVKPACICQKNKSEAKMVLFPLYNNSQVSVEHSERC